MKEHKHVEENTGKQWKNIKCDKGQTQTKQALSQA
jgi:hypothetical protein